MNNFSPIPLFPQQSGRVGDRGLPGANGAPGPAGANGADGGFTFVQLDFDDTDLHVLDVPTAIPVTSDQPNVLQVVVFGMFEINKTHLAGAGAVPQWLVRYRGTAVNAMNLGVSDLGNTRNFAAMTEATALTLNSGVVGTPPAGAGLGLETIWSASYAPSTFSGTARLTLIIAEIALRF